jgi:hypothetical protein
VRRRRSDQRFRQPPRRRRSDELLGLIQARSRSSHLDHLQSRRLGAGGSWALLGEEHAAGLTGSGVAVMTWISRIVVGFPSTALWVSRALVSSSPGQQVIGRRRNQVKPPDARGTAVAMDGGDLVLQRARAGL